MRSMGLNHLPAEGEDESKTCLWVYVSNSFGGVAQRLPGQEPWGSGSRLSLRSGERSQVP